MNRSSHDDTPLFDIAVAKLSFDTTPCPDAKPWRLVADRAEKLEVFEYFFGAMFLASGMVVTNASTSA